MVQVTWSEPALQDLEEIHSFIARGSTHFAKVTVERIFDAAKRLTNFPQLGQVPAEKSLKRYREILAGNYRIIYREIDSSRWSSSRSFMPAVIYRRSLRDANPTSSLATMGPAARVLRL